MRRSDEFDLRALSEAVDAQRVARGMSWPQAARAIGGVSASTLRAMHERCSGAPAPELFGGL